MTQITPKPEGEKTVVLNTKTGIGMEGLIVTTTLPATRLKIKTPGWLNPGNPVKTWFQR